MYVAYHGAQSARLLDGRGAPCVAARWLPRSWLAACLVVAPSHERAMQRTATGGVRAGQPPNDLSGEYFFFDYAGVRCTIGSISFLVDTQIKSSLDSCFMSKGNPKMFLSMLG